MSSATATGRGAALPSLTGVRGIAAFGVFASHLHYLFPVERSVTGVAGPGGNLQRIRSWGANGVSLFFVLSGFVLAWTWTDGTDSRTFWRRRFARV